MLHPKRVKYGNLLYFYAKIYDYDKSLLSFVTHMNTVWSYVSWVYSWLRTGSLYLWSNDNLIVIHENYHCVLLVIYSNDFEQTIHNKTMYETRCYNCRNGCLSAQSPWWAGTHSFNRLPSALRITFNKRKKWNWIKVCDWSRIQLRRCRLSTTRIAAAPCGTVFYLVPVSYTAPLCSVDINMLCYYTILTNQ